MGCIAYLAPRLLFRDLALVIHKVNDFLVESRFLLVRAWEPRCLAVLG